MTNSLDHLHEIRRNELAAVFLKYGRLFEKRDVLEIGSGSGFQLEIIQTVARTAVGVDIASSEYQPSPQTRVVIFDGSSLPFADRTFDIVYSSNAMEHVTQEPALHWEMRRVLRDNGVALHVVPSSSWRLWTMLTHYLKVPELAVRIIRHRLGWSESERPPVESVRRPKAILKLVADALCAPRHGERGNRLTEWWHFRASSWRRRFEELGWNVETIEGAGVFYTGYIVAPRLMSIERRRWSSKYFGSASLICFMKPKLACGSPWPTKENSVQCS